MSDILIILTLLLVGIIGLYLGATTRFDFRIPSASPLFRLNRHDRNLLDNLPIMCWLEDDGQVIWANKMHREIAKQNHPITMAHARALRQGDPMIMAQLDLQHPTPATYLLAAFKHTKGQLVFAFADQLFETSNTARANVGLTDAFTKLPIGIAVFDKNGELVSFNPILENQLRLPPSWLGAKPSLRMFLDRLRSDGTLPEPRDFTTWRDEITTLSTKGDHAIYSEDWYLINETVLRVTGQPSHNATTTFTFEDISRQIAIEREYGLQIDQLHMVLDHLDSAIVMFDASGVVNYANSEFRHLSQNVFGDTAPIIDVNDFLHALDTACLPSPDLADMRQFILNELDRSAWQSKLILKTAGLLYLRILPLLNGYSLFEFSDIVQRDPLARERNTGSSQR